MASSSSNSLDPSATSYTNFTFSTVSHPFMNNTSSFSFSDIFASPTDNTNNLGGSERPRGLLDRSGSGVPKFKSTPPPSLPLSPISPSSYFTIPPGFSLAQLLDSPVLLNSSNIFPSPTTGALAAQVFNSGENQQKNKQEERGFSGFSFQSQPRPPVASLVQTQQAWSFQEATTQGSLASGMSMVKTENSSSSMRSFTAEIASVQNNQNSGFQSGYNEYQPQAQTLTNKSYDGYNWRKYGQKQVKGSENPRSYYKCTYPNCPTKKKVECSLLDGQITEIVYKGTHNHPKPESTRRNTASSLAIPSSNQVSTEVHDQSYASSHGSGHMDSTATPENSSISMGDDDFEKSSQRSKSDGDNFDEDEPVAKRWRIEGENDGISAAGSRTVREPRVVVQTTSEIDILDDGYRWRKYGQKVVKGNPNPRSYYKCTYPGCPVRKHVERASHDLRAVITTYEGKHNHDVPAPRVSGSHSINRPLPTNTTNNIRSSAVSQYTNNHINNSLAPEGQSPFSLEMLQTSGSFGFSGFGNPMESYMNPQSDNVFISKAKEEPRDDLFLESLLR